MSAPLTAETDKIISEAIIGICRWRSQNTTVTLKDVHDVYRKWFHLWDTNRLDVVLAVALSRKMEGTALWLILVSRSGDMKSEQVTALDDDNESAKLVHRLTDKTLVNGFKDKKEFPDLAPLLNDKILLIPDMAEILQLHPNIKAQVWAQLRDLYDGYAGLQTGMGTDVQYRDLRVTLIAASTPAIDEQILIHQSLGTREFIYRPKEVVDVNDLMHKAWFNEDYEKHMRLETKAVVQNFVKRRQVRQVPIPEEVRDRIMRLARYLAVMRASAPTDSYSGDLRGFVYPEQPSRILKQLKRLYVCLKLLDDDYPDDRAIEIVREVVESSVDRVRQKVLAYLVKTKFQESTSQVSEALKIGKKAAKTELNILWYLGLIKRQAEEITTPYGQTVLVRELWQANPENEDVKTLMDLTMQERPSPDDKEDGGDKPPEKPKESPSPINNIDNMSHDHCNSVTPNDQQDKDVPVTDRSESASASRCDICKDVRPIVGRRQMRDTVTGRPVMFAYCDACGDPLVVFDSRKSRDGTIDSTDFRDALADAGFNDPVSIVDHLLKTARLFEPRPGVLKRV